VAQDSRPSDLYPNGWVKVPYELLEDPALTASDKLVFVAVASWVQLKKTITYREIRQRSGLTSWRAIRRSLLRLVEAGYLTMEVRGKGQRGGNRFTLNPIPPAPRAGASDAGGAPKTPRALLREQGLPLSREQDHKRASLEIERSSSSETITPEQLAAGHRAVDQKISNGLAVMNRDALARKIALEDFDENGNPTTGNGSPTEPPKPAIDSQVEACSLCDFRGFRLEPWATADDPLPIVPPIHCDHTVATLEETS